MHIVFNDHINNAYTLLWSHSAPRAPADILFLYVMHSHAFCVSEYITKCII